MRRGRAGGPCARRGTVRVPGGLHFRAGIPLLEIATAAGVSEATLSRFEQGDGWRRQTNQIVTAYAHACGTTERDLWQAALNQDA